MLAIVGFGAALEGYLHHVHPLGVLGARGVPHALAFNVLGFVLPGLLLTGATVLVRGQLPDAAGRSAAIGCWLLALSALAFAAQGGWSLDLRELDGPRSRGHTTAWTLWWIAFVPGAGLLAAGLWRVAGWRMFAALMGMCAAAVLLLAALPPLLFPGPVAQRVGLVIWLATYCLLASVVARRPPH